MASTRGDRGLRFIAVIVSIACLVVIAALVLAAIMLSMIRAGNTSTSSKSVVPKHKQGKRALEYTTWLKFAPKDSRFSTRVHVIRLDVQGEAFMRFWYTGTRRLIRLDEQFFRWAS